LSQQFGTALRGKTETALRRTSRPSVLATATQPLVGPFRQARYASTQPAAALPAAASAAASDAPANAAALADVTATPVSLTGSDLLDIPEQIGFLKTLGLDYGWGPTSLMQMLLESTYVYTGLPWWASIAIVAVGIRAVLAKPTLDASENAQKLQQLLRDPRYNEAKTAMMASWAGGNHMAAVDARVRLQRMNREVGYKGWKSLAPLIQLPLGIGMFRLLSGMAALPVPSFENGGFLWLTDLTVADPYFILPIMTGLVLTSSLRVCWPPRACASCPFQLLIAPSD
jgi:YidC/Oxa1 family membrane protein insertase